MELGLKKIEMKQTVICVGQISWTMLMHSLCGGGSPSFDRTNKTALRRLPNIEKRQTGGIALP
jgi:hypothetical protein